MAIYKIHIMIEAKSKEDLIEKLENDDIIFSFNENSIERMGIK